MHALLMIDAFDGEYVNQEDANDCFRYMCVVIEGDEIIWRQRRTLKTG